VKGLKGLPKTVAEALLARAGRQMEAKAAADGSEENLVEQLSAAGLPKFVAQGAIDAAKTVKAQRSKKPRGKNGDSH
jgi:hypothetical protein